jgi:hypothetical protein
MYIGVCTEFIIILLKYFISFSRQGFIIIIPSSSQISLSLSGYVILYPTIPLRKERCYVSVDYPSKYSSYSEYSELHEIFLQRMDLSI